MRRILSRAGGVFRQVFEAGWHYLGSLAAVSLFAAVLGLGIYHAVVQDAAGRVACYAGMVNPAGAEPPRGTLLLGKCLSPGVAHTRMEYSAEGRLQRMRHLDAENRLCPWPGSKVAEQRLYYNKDSRLIRKENRDETGRSTPDAHGVASREFEYDAAGRLVRTRFLDAAGRLTRPRFPGYAECRMSYDEQGRPRQVLYLDAMGQPVVNAAGEEKVEYEYGAGGSVCRRNFVGGSLADNREGVAQECFQTEPGGTRRSWQNAKGEPVVQPDLGAASLVHESSPATGVSRRRYLDVRQQPCTSTRACAEHLMRTDRAGRLAWEFYGGADGLAVNHPVLGYAERVCEYADDGRLEREYFWDASGHAAPVYESRYTETPEGTYALHLHADGSTEVLPR